MIRDYFFRHKVTHRAALERGGDPATIWKLSLYHLPMVPLGINPAHFFPITGAGFQDRNDHYGDFPLQPGSMSLRERLE